MMARLGNVGKERGERSRSGFVYTPPKASFVKQQANRKFSRFDSMFKSNYEPWRPKEGENSIRILPATWDGHEDYAYTIWFHRYVGQDTSNYLCLRKMLDKRCPICAEAEKSRRAREEEEAKQLSAVEGKVAWILSRDEKKVKTEDLSRIIRPYQIPITLYKDINALCYSEKTGKTLFIDHPDEGYDVGIRRTGAQLNTRYLPTIDRDPSPIADRPKDQDEIIDYITEHPIPDVLEFKDADYLEKVMSGTGEEKDADLDEEEEEEEEERKPRRKKRDDDEDDEDDRPRRAKRSADEDEDVDEEDEEDEDEDGAAYADDDEEEEEEEEERPKRKKLKSKRSDDDEEEEEEEENEEENEEDEEPKSRRKIKTRRKPVDEEEEEEEEEEEAPKSRRHKTGRRSSRR